MKLKIFNYIYFALLCFTSTFSTGRTLEEARENYLRQEKLIQKVFKPE